MQARVRPSPLTILVSLFFLGNTGVAVSAAFADVAPPGFLFLYYVGVAWAFASWVLSDCRARRIATSVDHGWFIFYAWPVAVPYHVLKTRGIRGCGLLLGLVGSFVAAYAVALVVFLILMSS